MQLIRDFLLRHKITETTFAIGVSGGADSLALALLFKQEFPNYRLIALTVDHGLRPSSRQEAEYVAKVMQKYNIEHHILYWEGEKPSSGIEEQARIARYRLLCNWCHTHDIHYLVTAHHLYDQAETFLMRIQRGSGVYGLAAMGEVTNKNGIQLLRPFLQTAPDELKKFLKKQNISWIEDESNSDDKFLRVRLRKILPYLEKATGISPKRLALAAKNLDNTKSLLDKLIADFMEQYVCEWDNIAYSFDASSFIAQHQELQFYIMGKLLNSLGQQNYPPEAEALYSLLDMMKNTHFSSATLNNCFIQKIDLKFWIVMENREISKPYLTADWDTFVAQHPKYRGLKIPHKMKALLLENNYSKKI